MTDQDTDTPAPKLHEADLHLPLKDNLGEDGDPSHTDYDGLVSPDVERAIEAINDDTENAAKLNDAISGGEDSSDADH